MNSLQFEARREAAVENHNHCSQETSSLQTPGLLEASRSDLSRSTGKRRHPSPPPNISGTIGNTIHTAKSNVRSKKTIEERQGSDSCGLQLILQAIEAEEPVRGVVSSK